MVYTYKVDQHNNDNNDDNNNNNGGNNEYTINDQMLLEMIL